jgi:GT2 family glycosyltransferase
VEILKKYSHLKWVSEKDNGQADALNKGFAMATGDIIGWTNSDDYYADNIMSEVARYFRDDNTHWVIGNITLIFEDTGTKIINVSPLTNYDQLICNPDIVRQQGTFIRKSLIEQVGGWNPDLYMVMDFDLWIRLAKLSTPKMVNKQWAFFRCHEAQKSTYANINRQAREIREILSREQVSMSVALRVNMKKRWYGIKGVIKQKLNGKRM